MVHWWCRLGADDIDALDALAGQGAANQIDAWVVVVKAQTDGTLRPELPLDQLLGTPTSGPRFCLELHLPESLTPRSEERVAEALSAWLVAPQAACWNGQPLLLLSDCKGFSHPHFGLQRLWLVLQREFRKYGCFQRPVLIGDSQAWSDAVVAVVQQPAAPQPLYRQHLRQAHYGPWPDRITIPCVSPPPDLEKGASKDHYAEWLAQAGAVSCLYQDGSQQAPVLLQSWSGHQQWCSSAGELPHLLEQPLDQPFEKLTDSAAGPTGAEESLHWGTMQRQHLALLVHGFYLERLEDLLKRLPAGGYANGLPGIDLYVSTPRSQLRPAAELLRRLKWPRVQLYGVENRGRDIAPFLLQLLPAVLEHGHQLLVKVHTKASPHLGDGEPWREHLLDALLRPEALLEIVARFQQDSQLGLLAPAGTLLPCSVALYPNQAHLLALLKQSERSGRWLLQQRFIAGSMMAARVEAMAPLTLMGLKLKDFEEELGQTDGTLAHACERWIGATASAEGWSLEVLSGDTRSVPGFGFG
ncbi:MAG: rhamnan synthesis F family protein [Prochlorococcus sp.]